MPSQSRSRRQQKGFGVGRKCGFTNVNPSIVPTNGRKALGGNLCMCDGHVEFRKLRAMRVRSVQSNGGPVPAFWW